MINSAAVVIPAMVRALANGHPGNPAYAIAEAHGAPPAAVRILKAAVGAGNLSDPAWAGDIADMNAAARAFLQSLGGRSAFAALIDQGVITRAPLRSRVGAAVSGVVGSVVEEGAATPVRRMTINADPLAPHKAQAMVVFSKEVMSNQSTASQAFVARQLRRGVAKALDVGFAGLLTAGVTPIASTGTHIPDLKLLLDAVNTGEGRLAWVAAGDVANRVALLDDPRGTAAPAGVTEFLGLPFAVSAGLAAGTLILLDGDQIVGEIVEAVGIEIAHHASLQMDDTPTMNADTPTAAAAVSLWQTNAVAIRLSALFGATRGTDDALAIMTGIAW